MSHAGAGRGGGDDRWGGGALYTMNHGTAYSMGRVSLCYSTRQAPKPAPSAARFPQRTQCRRSAHFWEHLADPATTVRESVLALVGKNAGVFLRLGTRAASTSTGGHDQDLPAHRVDPSFGGQTIVVFVGGLCGRMVGDGLVYGRGWGERTAPGRGAPRLWGLPANRDGDEENTKI